jgi:Zn finger protein HypA/HybF involved in hydrogenase expression|tara:strand:- start:48 stop:290 length:243 start_codon:yes stop_codon:yes gene_type:complete
MKKIQDSEIIGYQTIEGKQVPMLKPEVHHRIYCKNCDNEVDSDEEATGLCSNCGEPWAVHKAKDILVKVIQIPLGSGTGE